MTPALLSSAPWHLGQLHAQEQLIVLLVAFGPFVVLVAVVLVLRRRAAAEAEVSGVSGASSGAPAGAPGPSSGAERPPTYDGPGRP